MITLLSNVRANTVLVKKVTAWEYLVLYALLLLNIYIIMYV